MLNVPNEDLRARAEKIVAALVELHVKASVGEGKARIGGGTLPRSVIRSVTVDLAPEKIRLEELACRLRLGSPPVVGYVSGGHFKLDLRTVFPRQDDELLAALRQALAS